MDFVKYFVKIKIKIHVDAITQLFGPINSILTKNVELYNSVQMYGLRASIWSNFQLHT